MKIAITGSSGFVGSHLSQFLATEGHEPVPISRTIIKAGMTYGRGDHMLDHLSHAIHTIPVFATVGMHEKPIRPLAIQDLVAILGACSVDGRLSRQTVGIVGAEELLLSEAVRRVAGVLGRRVFVLPCPVAVQFALAQVFEWTMTVPLVAKAQVRILSEGVVEAVPAGDPLPPDLAPKRKFDETNIRAGLPAPGPFGFRDLRCCVPFCG